MKTCYLAGPMSGIASFNFPAFYEAAAYLRSIGWEVFSPAERDLQDGFDPDTDAAKPMSWYMQIDLPEVCKADAVICLPGWQGSKGCGIEVFTALSCDIPVLEYPDLGVILPWPPFHAFETTREVMIEGLRKHSKNSWLFEDANRHAMKSARHALSWMSIKDGHQAPDGENHSRMMLCRAAMVVAQQKLVTQG